MADTKNTQTAKTGLLHAENNPPWLTVGEVAKFLSISVNDVLRNITTGAIYACPTGETMPLTAYVNEICNGIKRPNPYEANETWRVRFEYLQAFISSKHIEDRAETTPNTNRPWVHLIDSPNPKTGNLYKQDAKRIREGMTAEERRMWAREAMTRNGGNKTAAGLELGITGVRIGQLLKPKP